MSLLIFGAAAVAYVAFLRPAEGLDSRARRLRAAPAVRPTADAFGRSGRLRMRFALPGEWVDLPIEVQVPLDSLRYTWQPLRTARAPEPPRPLSDGLLAPSSPGFYRLEVLGPGERRVVGEVTLAVLVPFQVKRGTSALNGYRIGFYRGERWRQGSSNGPVGFLEVDSTHLDLPLTRHLRVGDFLARDRQGVWPRYAAVDLRLLDKVELVLDRVAALLGTSADSLALDIHSAFRTPLYNRRIPHAATDSRHQFGDALDFAVDANGDGRIDGRDLKLVAMAVELVERSYPELSGGLGIYVGRGRPYLHVDARGQRVRWRG
ncbi:MAG TPA: hypothetical protein VNL96_10170 [Gemmatimonadaceae bacterium]|nr:hypothetical protein [Gemmatimonadaceae bacterium]